MRLPSLPAPAALALRPFAGVANLVWRVAQRYIEANAGNWATLIAWNFLFSFFPLVLVAASVVGVLLRNPQVAISINGGVAASFGADHRGQMEIFDALNNVQQRSGLFALVGVIGLLWSGTSLFAAIDQGLSALYGGRQRDFFPQRLMGVGMVVLLTVLTVPVMLSATLLPLVRELHLPTQAFISSGAAEATQWLASVADGTLLFGAIYLIVPNRRQRIRHVLPGAITAGALFTVFSLLFTVYTRHFGAGFARFGATFALFFVLLTYFFSLGQITVIGALVAVEMDPNRAPPTPPVILEASESSSRSNHTRPSADPPAHGSGKRG